MRGFDTTTAVTHAAASSLIAHVVPSEVVARRALDALRRLEIIVGNLYEEVTSRDRNTNKWTMYVTLAGAAGEHTAKLIEKVVYELHPTFRPSMVTATPPNFSICRYGWGTFTVECQIHWVSWLAMPPTLVDHDLEFEGNGGRTASSVEVNPCVVERLHAEISLRRSGRRGYAGDVQSRRQILSERRAAIATGTHMRERRPATASDARTSPRRFRGAQHRP